MIRRLCRPSESNSFFLFGARGTGKSSLLRGLFAGKNTLWYDLLLPQVEEKFALHPELLTQEISALPRRPDWIVLDEVQKVPALLDLVHHHIEKDGLKFVLSGSSARRLKRGGANLLAGRAFVSHLYPFTHRELGAEFDLKRALEMGTLPKPYGMKAEADLFLESYALTYFKEEIVAEQWVRDVTPFRKFMGVAGQMNGKVINLAKIGREVGVDPATVHTYFEILEDTHLGLLLPGFDRSFRKRLTKAPKFYLFDPGVKRALDRTLTVPLLEQTSAFGDAFEHFVILEAHRLNDYSRARFDFSYIRTKDGAEVDLVADRPGRPLALIEIKSKSLVTGEDAHGLEALASDLKGSEAFLLSRDQTPKRFGKVVALPWQQGLTEIGF